tara:strand:- start:76 stop:306 length:231 start_codon:yes stop_codon:yes gene_type:complete
LAKYNTIHSQNPFESRRTKDALSEEPSRWGFLCSRGERSKWISAACLPTVAAASTAVAVVEGNEEREGFGGITEII